MRSIFLIIINELIAIAERKGKLFELEGKVDKYNDGTVNTCNSIKRMTNKEKWHRILGHPNFNDLKHICEFQLLDGVPNKIENDELKCEICITSKMSNLRFKNNRSKANDLLEIVHTDVNGPMSQQGINGEKYFVSFIDDFSKLAVVYCIKNKSDVNSRVVDYINLMQNQTGKKIREVRCDNGGEFINRELIDLGKRNGIYIRPCPPYSHELKGVAERYNRTIMDRARCLLTEADIDKSYWPECIYTAAYLGNRLIANLHIFGSKAYVRLPDVCRKSKLNQKAVKGILIGYTDMGYKVLVNRKIIVSRNVQFIDNDVEYIKLNFDKSDEDEQ